MRRVEILRDRIHPLARSPAVDFFRDFAQRFFAFETLSRQIMLICLDYIPGMEERQL